MHNTAVHLVANDGHRKPQEVTLPIVRAALKGRGLRFIERSLSNLKQEDIERSTIFVQRKEGPLLILPIDQTSFLNGLRRREGSMRFTTMKSAGIIFDTVLSQRYIDSFVIEYCWEQTAIVVSASRLMEHLG